MWSATVTGRGAQALQALWGQVNWPPVRAKQLSRLATCDFIIESAKISTGIDWRNSWMID